MWHTPRWPPPHPPAPPWAAAQFSAALNTIDADRKTQSVHPELLHPAAAKEAYAKPLDTMIKNQHHHRSGT
jgi:hypothetical protein